MPITQANQFVQTNASNNKEENLVSQSLKMILIFLQNRFLQIKIFRYKK